MRNNEQFKELVYKRADELNIKNKKKRAIILRGVAAMSLFIVVGGVFVYSNFFGENAVAESSVDMIYGDFVDSGYGNKGIGSYYSLSDTSRAAAEVENEIADLSLDDEAYAEGGIVSKFSFADEVENFKSEDAEEISESATEKLILSPSEALSIAKSKCTVEYDSTGIYYDDATDTWKVVFSTKDTLGGCQTVYLSGSGEIKFIVYGE